MKTIICVEYNNDGSLKAIAGKGLAKDFKAIKGE